MTPEEFAKLKAEMHAVYDALGTATGEAAMELARRLSEIDAEILREEEALANAAEAEDGT